MIAYRYLTGPDNPEFCQRVTGMLNRGWTLAGPPTLTYDAAREAVICGQTLTKEKSDLEYDPEISLESF